MKRLLIAFVIVFLLVGAVGAKPVSYNDVILDPTITDEFKQTLSQQSIFDYNDVSEVVSRLSTPVANPIKPIKKATTSKRYQMVKVKKDKLVIDQESGLTDVITPIKTNKTTGNITELEPVKMDTNTVENTYEYVLKTKRVDFKDSRGTQHTVIVGLGGQ